jgi:transposase-like protein
MQPKEKRRRRRHTPAFKAAAVAACRKPGASVAAVALELQLNANMLRTWIKQSSSVAVIPKPMSAPGQPPTPTPAFLPVPLPARTEPPSTERPIRVHIRKGRSRITIEWPTTAAGACATWLRELLG